MSLPLLPGDLTRLGGYELLGRLGRGGMGTVYLGRGADGRQVAIKVIRAELAWDNELRARFRSEVNRARQVPPFSTAAVLDADADHDPPYLVVEYVQGPSLAEVVRDRGPLTPEALHSVAVGIATALTAIHGAGVIHRDLKPQNVLLALGGLKVIDFGIARTLEATSQHTRTDQLVGTAAYMAPERFEAHSRQGVTPAADIFAWGVVVAYAATGRTPFGGDSAPATALRIISQPPDLTGLTRPLRGLVERALAKDPAARPTARELLDEVITVGAPGVPLRRTARPDLSVTPLLTSSPPTAITPARAFVPPRRTRRVRIGSSVAAAVVVSAIVWGAAYAQGSSRSADPGKAAVTAAGPVQQLGGKGAAASVSSRPETPAARRHKEATPRAVLELLSRLLPDRELSRYSTFTDRDDLFVQLLMDSGDGPGRIGLTIARRPNPASPVRAGEPTIEVSHAQGNCIQDTVAVAEWTDGTLVQLDVSSCLFWDGRSNPPADPALDQAEARRLVSDPRWGVTMDAEIVDAGAKKFENLRIIKG